ncbi:alpha/beta hydrolase fold domain-containing protein [Verrucomicrobiaceae bacterium R5-34]|nr:alpha/beta hydrolase fold domain-containing protein [Verrucomicrobiaceae bacterium R5-34]
MKTKFLLFLLCSLLLSSWSHAQKPDQKPVYKKVGDVSLKLHIFNPKDHKATDQKPAIVFFFGGGWKGGKPQQFYPHCEYLASRGIVAISAEYRVSSKHKTTPKECVMDGKSALRWVRSNAGKLGVDPEKILAGGGSAGGHVAAAAAMAKGMDQPGEDTSVSCVPKALVLFNPVYDNGPGGYGHNRVKAYWKQISPMHNIDAKTPPTIVFLGEKDHLVPVKTAKKYQALMKKAGVRNDLHLYPGQTHGFFNLQKSKEKYRETMIETDRFLSSLGYLTGEPTLSE